MNEQTPTILCVDDDPEILAILKEYFTSQGFNVVTATNGVEAMFQVQRCEPKAIIIDLFMPRLGGLGALDRIRRLLPEIVVILISGIPGVLEMVAEAGVSVAGVFAKPLDLGALRETLARAGVRAPKQPGKVSAPGRRRIIVVDDEPEIRDLLVEYLRDKGFEALGVGDGQEALQRIPEFGPHIVLLDIAMPRITGVEVLKRIKALPQQMAVIMVSGIEDVETARQTLALGAADYVTKPVDFQYLDSVLEVHTFMDQI